MFFLFVILGGEQLEALFILIFLVPSMMSGNSKQFINVY